MSQCPKLETCRFYKNEIIVDLGIGDYLKKQYCLSGNVENCARHMVSREVGAEYVEDTLFPNNVEKAQRIIKNIKQNNQAKE